MIRNHDRQRRHARLDAAAGVVGFLIVCILLAVGIAKVQGQPYKVVDDSGQTVAEVTIEKLVFGEVENTAPSFQVYEAVWQSSSPPDGWPEWVDSIGIIYGNQLWPEGADRTNPDIDFIREVVSEVAQKHDIIVINVEHWPLHNAEGDELRANVQKYVSLMRAANEAAGDDARVGLYSMLPVRNYWAPVGNKEEKRVAWTQRNAELAEIAEHVDVIFPSLYTFYDNQRGWRIYARANIAEAQRYGKPVIPFVMPTFHESGKLGGQRIPGDYWRMQLELTLSNCGGVVIWDIPNKGWNEQEQWWKATQEFADMSIFLMGRRQGKGLGQTPNPPTLPPDDTSSDPWIAVGDIPLNLTVGQTVTIDTVNVTQGSTVTMTVTDTDGSNPTVTSLTAGDGTVTFTVPDLTGERRLQFDTTGFVASDWIVVNVESAQTPLPYSDAVLADDPVLFLFDVDGSGNWDDFTANGNDGTPVGNPTVIDGLVPGIPVSFRFNGVDQYVRVSDAAALDVNGSITIEWWERREGANDTWDTRIAKGNDAYIIRTSNKDFPSVEDPDSLSFDVRSAASDRFFRKNGISELGVVNHCMARWNDTTGEIDLWVNGEKQDNPGQVNAGAAGDGIRQTADDITIGAQEIGGVMQRYFHGDIAALAIYGKVLSVERYNAHAQSVAGPTPTPEPEPEPTPPSGFTFDDPRPISHTITLAPGSHNVSVPRDKRSTTSWVLVEGTGANPSDTIITGINDISTPSLVRFRNVKITTKVEGRSGGEFAAEDCVFDVDDSVFWSVSKAHVYNCDITSDKSVFGGNIGNYDAFGNTVTFYTEDLWRASTGNLIDTVIVEHERQNTGQHPDMFEISTAFTYSGLTIRNLTGPGGATAEVGSMQVVAGGGIENSTFENVKINMTPQNIVDPSEPDAFFAVQISGKWENITMKDVSITGGLGYNIKDSFEAINFTVENGGGFESIPGVTVVTP